MTQYNLSRSDSTPQGLVVALAAPAPEIIGVNWPSSPKAWGAQCKTDISYRNDGGDGDIFLRVVDSTGTVKNSIVQSVAAGETGIVSLYFNMPASDIIIYAQVGVDTTVTDTSLHHRIEVLITIGTTLTLALSPTSVEPGETVSFSGKLTRIDDEPTGIQTIKIIDDVSGTLKATIQTSTNGNYSGVFTAPSAKGTYYYAAEFGGASLAVSMYVLEPSSSTPRIISVGINYVLNIFLPLTVGIAMIAASLYSP